MKNLKEAAAKANLGQHIKSFTIKVMVVVNIATVGAGFGAYWMHQYDAHTATKAQSMVQAALKSVSVVQAIPSPKAVTSK